MKHQGACNGTLVKTVETCSSDTYHCLTCHTEWTKKKRRPDETLVTDCNWANSLQYCAAHPFAQPAAQHRKWCDTERCPRGSRFIVSIPGNEDKTACREHLSNTIEIWLLGRPVTIGATVRMLNN